MSDTLEPNVHEEPCLECGEETAVGRYFFSDRDRVEFPDGNVGYLCSECVKRGRSAGYHPHWGNMPLTPHGATYMWFGGVELPHDK